MVRALEGRVCFADCRLHLAPRRQQSEEERGVETLEGTSWLLERIETIIFRGETGIVIGSRRKLELVSNGDEVSRRILACCRVARLRIFQGLNSHVF
ncbi:hypothetical protein DL98DRAFT_96831 [Cadophora sp. DSE1049]|nr:hypothetical protein DL98DRAFT_96831 [Cadophora sp. DSE1049]